jgi:hypothetical protein
MPNNQPNGGLGMSIDNFLDFQYSLIIVDKRPYCVWDRDLKKRNLEFLEFLDPSYYDYIADTHLQNIADGDEATSNVSQHAALALRSTYSQALETLFALISAAIQAPRCVPAWFYLYKNQELRSVIDKIQNFKQLLSHINKDCLSWKSVSEAIFQSFVIEDKEKESAIKAGFAQLWSRFASDFLDDDFTHEYNSIKHGLRIRPGGFRIAMGVEETPGVHAPAENMSLLGKSDFGTGYIATEKIGELGHHVQMKRHHRNWNPEDLAWGLHTASLSISNVCVALKILNGVNPKDILFHYPIDLSLLLEPWKRSHQIGVTTMSGFDINIRPDFIEAFSKERILADYKAGKRTGVKRLFFGDPPDNSENTTS